MAKISRTRIDYSRVQLSKADIERLNKIVENSRSHGNGDIRYHSKEDFIERSILNGIETYEKAHQDIVNTPKE
jgi:hypothetical protein